MNIVPAMILGCDGPDEDVPCPDRNGFWAAGHPDSSGAVHATRESAERAGWLVVETDDGEHVFCPECVKTIGRDKE